MRLIEKLKNQWRIYTIVVCNYSTKRKAEKSKNKSSYTYLELLGDNRLKFFEEYIYRSLYMTIMRINNDQTLNNDQKIFLIDKVIGLTFSSNIEERPVELRDYIK